MQNGAAHSTVNHLWWLSGLRRMPGNVVARIMVLVRLLWAYMKGTAYTHWKGGSTRRLLPSIKKGEVGSTVIIARKKIVTVAVEAREALMRMNQEHVECVALVTLFGRLLMAVRAGTIFRGQHLHCFDAIQVFKARTVLQNPSEHSFIARLWIFSYHCGAVRPSYSISLNEQWKYSNRCRSFEL
jgi:hypothetical protein